MFIPLNDIWTQRQHIHLLCLLSRMWTPSIWRKTPETSTCRTSAILRTGDWPSNTFNTNIMMLIKSVNTRWGWWETRGIGGVIYFAVRRNVLRWWSLKQGAAPEDDLLLQLFYLPSLSASPPQGPGGNNSSPGVQPVVHQTLHQGLQTGQFISRLTPESLNFWPSSRTDRLTRLSRKSAHL